MTTNRQQQNEQSVVVMEPVELDEFLSHVKLEYFTYANRLATFKGIWRYEGVEGATCTAEKMARAGFYCSEQQLGTDSARCYVCQHELLWDPQDDPWEEHHNHRPDCELVKIGKQDEEEFTVLEMIRVMACIYSARMYDQVDESIADLKCAMDKLLLNATKAKQRK